MSCMQYCFACLRCYRCMSRRYDLVCEQEWRKVQLSPCVFFTSSCIESELLRIVYARSGPSAVGGVPANCLKPQQIAFTPNARRRAPIDCPAPLVMLRALVIRWRSSSRTRPWVGEEEEDEEKFIASGNRKSKPNSLSRGAGKGIPTNATRATSSNLICNSSRTIHPPSGR